MNYTELILFVRDMKLASNSLVSDRMIKHIFIGSQRSCQEQLYQSDVESTGKSRNATDLDVSEMDYHGFLESLAAISLVLYPSPYRAGANKIFDFLNHTLLPQLKQNV
jgi:hypothetical protein